MKRFCHQLINAGTRRGIASSSRAAAAVPSTMKAVVVHETGDSSKLAFEGSWPVPELKDGQCLIKNDFAGLNFIDTYHRSGMYARDLPFIGGQEGAGVVAAVTPAAAAKGVKEGDRVAYSVLQTYAEYAAVPADKVLPVPDNVGLDVATACVVQGMTAHYLTHSAHADLIQPGEWMLIHGVSGGTCQWAAQMAKIKGYKVVGTCSKSKQGVAEKLGLDALVVCDDVPGKTFEDYESVDVVKEVMAATGGVGAKAIIDGVGLTTWEISLACLAQRGIFVTFGNASGAVPAFPPIKLIAKSGFLCRPKLLDYTRDREELLWRSGDIFKWVGEGKLNVAVDTAFPLQDAAAGHDYLEAGKSTGKVLYKI